MERSEIRVLAVWKHPRIPLSLHPGYKRGVLHFVCERRSL